MKPAPAMNPDVPLDLKPMEAEAVDALPTGPGWHFEPKYDGFRCVAYRNLDEVLLQSRNQKPLGRYFPELVEAMRALKAERFVLDGEIIIRGEAFETLQLRLHPAATRIATLASEHPATFIAFDMLVDGEGRSMLASPFAERRKALEQFMRAAGIDKRIIRAKATRKRATAESWLGGAGLDGVVAKRLDMPYRPGERAMQKYKLWKTVDCVVGGLYWQDGRRIVDSLLLGLYDDDGLLHYVGRARVGSDGNEMAELLTPLIGGPGFTGRAPGGKSRWSGRERKPVPLKPVLVAEVSADHITAGYMRHGARIVRWREDKPPADCTMGQIT